MTDIAIIFGVAAILGVLAKILRQPLILAYLFTGLLIGYFGLLNLEDQESIRLLSSVGVTLLLFLVGLEMDYTSLRKVGRVSLAIGVGQVLFTFFFGYIIANIFFGFEALTSAYIAIALTFSSTVIIIKLLSDKNAINSLYGRISIGLLLVQDFVVVVILVLLAGLDAGKEVSLVPILYITLQGVVFFLVTLYLGVRLFPVIFDKISRSQELIFLFTLAWVFLLVVVMESIGFSIELAGFLGGLALANSSQKYHIASRIRPLRDFFILAFFAMLGSLMVVSEISGMIVPIITFSFFVLIGNPLIVFFIMNLLGYKKRTSFLTGLTVAQISEFSLIVGTMGLTLGHIENEIFTLIAAVGVVTITVSTYLILYAEKIFAIISPFIGKDALSEEGVSFLKANSKPIVMFGGNRTGRGVLSCMPQKEVMVIDFDPFVIENLKKKGISCLFADITDPHLFESIDLSKTKTVISTSPNIEDNLFLLNKLKEPPLTIILRAETDSDAIELYKKGADYVFLPHLSSGQFIGEIIDMEKEKLKEIKDKDMETIKNI